MPQFDGDAPSIESLIDLDRGQLEVLRSHLPDERHRLLAARNQPSPQQTRDLIEDLTALVASSHEQVADAAAWAFHRIDQANAPANLLTDLTELLSRPDEITRAAAALALGQLDLASAQEGVPRSLLSCLRTDESARVRRRVAGALGRFGADAVNPSLIEGLARAAELDPAAGVRAAAETALANLSIALADVSEESEAEQTAGSAPLSEALERLGEAVRSVGLRGRDLVSRLEEQFEFTFSEIHLTPVVDSTRSGGDRGDLESAAVQVRSQQTDLEAEFTLGIESVDCIVGSGAAGTAWFAVLGEDGEVAFRKRVPLRSDGPPFLGGVRLEAREALEFRHALESGHIVVLGLEDD